MILKRNKNIYLIKLVFILLYIADYVIGIDISRRKRDGKADTSQPKIISKIGEMNPSSSHVLEPPPDHKGLVMAITIVFAFVFAVAGVFIGVYFRVERVLKCIDRIGGTNNLENDPLIDDTNSIIGSDAMTTLQKQNETGFVHSCPAEAYPMKKQIYERANKTPHTGICYNRVV